MTGPLGSAGMAVSTEPMQQEDGVGALGIETAPGLKGHGERPKGLTAFQHQRCLREQRGELAPPRMIARPPCPNSVYCRSAQHCS